MNHRNKSKKNDFETIDKKLTDANALWDTKREELTSKIDAKEREKNTLQFKIDKAQENHDELTYEDLTDELTNVSRELRKLKIEKSKHTETISSDDLLELSNTVAALMNDQAITNYNSFIQSMTDGLESAKTVVNDYAKYKSVLNKAYRIADDETKQKINALDKFNSHVQMVNNIVFHLRTIAMIIDYNTK